MFRKFLKILDGGAGWIQYRGVGPDGQVAKIADATTAQNVTDAPPHAAAIWVIDDIFVSVAEECEVDFIDSVSGKAVFPAGFCQDNTPVLQLTPRGKFELQPGARLQVRTSLAVEIWVTVFYHQRVYDHRNTKG